MTNVVSLGDKVFILQFSRFRWRCGTAEKQQSEHCCLIGDVGLYGHHGRATNFFCGVAGQPTASITNEPQNSLAVRRHKHK
ncbi:hypothetical protein TNCV_1164511 [Trichonephila clavipes]|nr:hypothetical protein TNCV_1164511 [Trichonephila clavipes]